MSMKITYTISREEVYDNQKSRCSSTFKSIDELVVIGINKNTIYREESLRKKSNVYSKGRYISKSK